MNNIKIDISETYLGYNDTLKGVQKYRVQTILDDFIRTDGETKSQKQWILDLLMEGYLPDADEDYTYYKRNGELSKPRTLHTMKKDGSYYETNKTLNNFATYLLNNNFLSVDNIEEFIKTERLKLEEMKRLEQEGEEKQRLEKERLDEQRRKEREERIKKWTEIGEKLMSDEVKTIITEVIENRWNEIIEAFPESNKVDLIKNYIEKNLPSRIGNYEHMKSIVSHLIHDYENDELSLNNSLEKEIFMRIYNIKENDLKRTITTKIKAFMEGREYKGSKPKEQGIFYIYNPKEKTFIEKFGDKIKINKFTLYGRWEEEMYILTEEKSGLIFTKGNTKTEAINNAKNKIKQNGVEKINTLIERSIEVHGSSPIMNE